MCYYALNVNIALSLERNFYMQEQQYYIEIESYIKRNEINKRRRLFEENYDTLKNYWEIGRLLVEA